MKNKILITSLVVLAVVAVGYLIFSNSNNQIANESIQPPEQSPAPDQAKDQSPAQPEENQVKIQEVAKNELPKDFPSDIPLEAGAEITLNFNTIIPTGELQATREFISAKTVTENLVLYKKILTENGWNITSTNEKSTVGSLIFADKGKNRLNIRVYIDPVSNKVKVAINNIVTK